MVSMAETRLLRSVLMVEGFDTLLNSRVSAIYSRVSAIFAIRLFKICFNYNSDNLMDNE